MAFYSRGFQGTTLLPRFVCRLSQRQLRAWSRAGRAGALLFACAFVVVAAKGGPVGNDSQAIKSTGSSSTGAAPSLHRDVLASYGHLPLSFEPNRGQSDARVKFSARKAGYTLFLTQTEAVFSLQHGIAADPSALPASAGNDAAGKLAGGITGPRTTPDAVLRVQLINANPNAAVTGLEQLPGKVNYIRGNDPSKWVANIPSYGRVEYSNVFRGIDLFYYGNRGQLEYDFVLAPGADPRSIGMKFKGAHNLAVEQQTGDLVITVGNQQVRFHQPVAYQPVADKDALRNGEAANGADPERRHLIAARYVVDANNHVGFAVDQYDRSQTLVIDPTLTYSTYLGGSSNDYANAIAVDGSGNAYVTGYTNSANFPVTPGAFQTKCSGTCSTAADAFISKLDPTGSFLVYSTYVGGASNDYGNGIALDSAGDAYIVGQTYSKNFPVTTGAYQTKCGGGGSCPGGDAFITELNPEGSALVYSTYLGGSGVDQGNAIALDASNNAYVTGYTQSTNFPTTPGAFQTTCRCSQSVLFVTELNSTGTALVYSTYLGGTSGDVGYAIALDSSDNAYVTGYTHSTNFPTTPGAFQTTLGADQGGFVSKLNPTGTALVYSTYLGGSTTDTTPCEACGTDIAVDSGGNAYVVGLTAESNFPVTPGAFQTTFMSSANGHDAFLAKLNPSGTGLVFATYLGGTGDDGATGVAVDAAGNTWIKGNTKSTNFPVTPGAFQLQNSGAYDFFLSEIDPTGSLLLYSTYLGGSGTEYVGATRSLAIDTQLPPNVYLTGYTNSTNFPVSTGAFQTKNGGLQDGSVTKFAPSPNLGLSSAALSFGNQNDGTTSAPQTITVTNTGNENLTVTNVSITGANNNDFGETNTCTTASVAPQSTCTINVTFTPSISGNETASVSITDNAPASPQLVSLTGFGVGSGPAVQLSATSLTFPVTVVGTQSKPQTVTLTNAGNSTLTITQIAASVGFTETNTCGTSVGVGASCTITITFKPTMPNAATGAVTITDNASGSPQSIALSGTGTVVTLSPATINFGMVTVGQSSTPHTATLRNASKSALAVTIALIGTDPQDFSETNTCGSSVPAASTCTITTTFTPLVKGALSATVSVTDAGGASPQTITLIGTGEVAK